MISFIFAISYWSGVPVASFCLVMIRTPLPKTTSGSCFVTPPVMTSTVHIPSISSLLPGCPFKRKGQDSSVALHNSLQVASMIRLTMVLECRSTH